MSTAILVDGGFFLKRYPYLFTGGIKHSAELVARNLYTMCLKHERKNLYRIFYYDCPPLLKKVHNPIDGACIDFSKTQQATFRLQLFEELKKKRKVALRLGHLQDGRTWLIKPHLVKELLNGTKKISDLQPTDVFYEVRQKGADIKIGVDIASLAYKKHVNQIVLISGDGDFVPAAKLARREGIDFILDPLWNPINPSLHEHIDGLKSYCSRPVPIKRITTAITSKVKSKT